MLAGGGKTSKKLSRGGGCRREGRGETKGTKGPSGKSDPTAPGTEEASRLLAGQLSVQVFKGVHTQRPSLGTAPRRALRLRETEAWPWAGPHSIDWNWPLLSAD